jgi:hypothetical protein
MRCSMKTSGCHGTPGLHQVAAQPAILLVAEFQIFRKLFAVALGDGNDARTDKLQEAVERLQFFVERADALRKPLLRDDGIGGVHFNDFAVVEADGFGNLFVFQEFCRGNLVERLLHDVDIVVGVVFRLDYVDFLFNLLGERSDCGFVRIAGDGVAVDVLNARWRHVEAFDVQLSAREGVGHLVEHARQVFREDDERVERLAFFRVIFLCGYVGGCVVILTHEMVFRLFLARGNRFQTPSKLLKLLV